MAQLDRFLSALVSAGAAQLRLAENEVAALEVGGALRPITKQPLNGPQLLMLLREIAPADAARALEAGEAVAFRYETPDGAFRARATPSATGWSATIAAEDATPATAAPIVSARHSGNGQTAVPASADAARARAEVEALMRRMKVQSSSDLHLRTGEPPIYRTHGEMHRLDGAAVLDNDGLTAMLLAIMPDRNRDEWLECGDTDFAHEIEGLGRFRANALRDRRGAAAVFRMIPAEVVTVEQMGISQEVQNLCHLSKGLVLVTGPTGSGKSTTLCALMDLVNRTRTDHVVTIEDPIEFVHPNKKCIFTQRQVGVHTGSFKSALRAALREDPDIVLVGELRDLETVAIAIETAETGHLVFGTLHTTTAASTIDRLIDQFPADRQEQVRVMLAESLKGVISQTLCKKIGGGRVAAREILLSIPAVSNLIREGKTFQIPSVMQTSRKIGMTLLTDALMELVDAKLVEPKEAYMKGTDKSAILNALKSRGLDTSFVETTESVAKAAASKAAAQPAASARQR